MTMPNKTVGNWRRKVGFPERERRTISPFIEWVAEQARAGATFSTIAEAEEKYAAAMEQK